MHSGVAPKVVAGAALSKEYTAENLPLVEKGARGCEQRRQSAAELVVELGLQREI